MDFKIKLFADGADIDQIKKLRKNIKVAGFTTNPTLLAKSGVSDYAYFANEAARIAFPLPISFEVFSDDLDVMYEQAIIINSWGENIYVKIPVTNTSGISTSELVSALAIENIKINVTAIMALDQVERICSSLNPLTPSVVSMFAGRIADTGVDPVPIMKNALTITKKVKNCELLWASPREIFNLIQAETVGCQIITMTPELWSKVEMLGMNLHELSIATIRMFHEDAIRSSLKI